MSFTREHSTFQEIKAEESGARLQVDIKKAQYMHKFLGEESLPPGCLRSIPSAFSVALDNSIEGLVHISESITDDYYEFNDRNYTLRGIYTGRTFAIGDEVKVKLVRVGCEREAKIDFELVENDGQWQSGRQRNRGRRKAQAVKCVRLGPVNKSTTHKHQGLRI